MLLRHSSRKEAVGGDAVLGVAGLRLSDGLPEVLQHGGQVGFELLSGLAELLDLRQLIVQEPRDQSVQLACPRHIDAHCLATVLEQHGGFRVLKDDVVAGVAPVELGLDFGVQVVVGVLGLPVAPSHAQGVLHRAVWDVGSHGQLRHQHQPLPVVPAVRRQTPLERRPNVQLAVRPAELNQLGQLDVVALNVRVGWHTKSFRERDGEIPVEGHQLGYAAPLASSQVAKISGG